MDIDVEVGSIWSDGNGKTTPAIGIVSVSEVAKETVHLNDPICGYKYQIPIERFLKNFKKLGK